MKCLWSQQDSKTLLGLDMRKTEGYNPEEAVANNIIDIYEKSWVEMALGYNHKGICDGGVLSC